MAAKSLETIRLVEALSILPDDVEARDALATHLAGLQQSAATLGLVHLDAALDGALRRLKRESFGPASLVAVRVLAWRYESLATMPSESGTHSVVGRDMDRGDTLRSLVDRVVAEIQRGLLDAALQGADANIDLGQITEVLAPVWKMIAQLRAMIEQRSGGAVRFKETLGVPLLTLSHVPTEESSAAEVSLQGRRVLVADDESEVRWFYVGVLREAGARVFEASDGVHALEIARRDPPDLILADILMPRLDGLGLCAAVRREPALDGVPVVLLSWREDFLHRMRELRAEAQDYLRKEVPARQILDRVYGVLEPLIHFEESLRSGEEARGDLEELGVSTLFRAVRRLRPNARIVLQDPWSLFEVQLHDGGLVQVSRTAIDGTVTRGAGALPALVGMSSGRFVVAEPSSDAPIAASEPLDEVFDEAIRRLSKIIERMTDSPDCRIEFDQDVLGTYARHSPRGVQELIQRLVVGESPSALWESGQGSRALVDALLVTLARQGAVDSVVVPEAAPDRPELIEPEAAADHELIEPEIERESERVQDPLERENLRAQSGVAMHQEPVNRAPKLTYPVWRVNAATRSGADESFGFGVEMQSGPGIVGWGFVLLFCATVAFIIWHEAMPGSKPAQPAPQPAAVGAALPTPAMEAVDAPSAETGGIDLSAFAGELRAGVDATLEVSEGQGVLDLSGPKDVGVEVNGIDRGELPVRLVLDEGRHVVRYRLGNEWTYRFYYVKAGATRTLRVAVDPGGFIDAR